MHKTEKCYSEHPELHPEGWKLKPGYVSLLKQKEQGDKKTYNLNEHDMNLIHFLLAMFQSSNTENVMIFKAITEISNTTLEQLQNLWVMDSGTTDHMHMDQAKFDSY